MRIIRPLKITSIRTRLILWIVAVLAFVLAIMSVILRYTLEAHLLASMDRDLARIARAMERRSESYRRGPHLSPPVDPEKLKKLIEQEKKAQAADPFLRFRPRFLNLQKKSFFPYSEDVSWDGRLLHLSAAGRDVHQTILVDNEPVRVFSMPVRQDGQVVAAIQTAYPLIEMYRNLHGLLYTLLMLITVALLITGLSAAFLAQRLLSPVRQITRTAAQVGAADLSQRLPVTGEDEFSRLASTFNAMLARLESAFEQLRRFTADASHELKTPLTAIKAHTSLALHGEKTPAEYRRSLEGADRAATLMTRIVQDLLLLARSDAGQLRPDLRPVSIRDILEASVDAIQGRKHPPIDLQLPDSNLQAFGDATLLTRLFANLLDNAARYTPCEGRITLSAAGDGTSLTVTVSDTGIGVAPEHLPHLCERFYRVDEARTRMHGGTGLGLAICESIVASHHGALALKSAPGKGTTVDVRLPQAG